MVLRRGTSPPFEMTFWRAKVDWSSGLSEEGRVFPSPVSGKRAVTDVT